MVSRRKSRFDAVDPSNFEWNGGHDRRVSRFGMTVLKQNRPFSESRKAGKKNQQKVAGSEGQLHTKPGTETRIEEILLLVTKIECVLSFGAGSNLGVVVETLEQIDASHVHA